MLMHTRKLKGFAVIERPDGALILGTFRPDQAKAWSAFRRHNPQVLGFPCLAQLVELEIFIHEGIEQCFLQTTTEPEQQSDTQ